MTEKDYLKAYMHRKAEIIPGLYWDEDFRDVDEWDDKTAECVLAELRDPTRWGSSAALCPHCYVYLCEDCPYGERHGVCGESGSTWEKVCEDFSGEPQEKLPFSRYIWALQALFEEEEVL